MADLGSDAFRRWQRRRSSWDTVLVKNGQRCKTWMMAKQPYHVGLQRIGAGPPAFYYSWLNGGKCLFLLGNPQPANSEPLRLFEIREPIDSAYFFPRGKEFKEWTNNRWDPPRFLLDTVFYEQGAWYALVVRYTQVLRPAQPPCLAENAQYMKCRLWRSDELLPAQLAALRQRYIAQLPAGYWSQKMAGKTTIFYPECDWLPPCIFRPGD